MKTIYQSLSQQTVCGRDYNQILEEWKDITRNIGADIIVLDMPLLDTRQNKDLLGTFISDLVLQILSYVAEQERAFIKQRQKEGIANALAKGVKFGKKSITKSDLEDDGLFLKYYYQWQSKKISIVEMTKLLGYKRRESTYLRIKIFEN